MLEHMPAPAGLGLGWETTACLVYVCVRETEREHTTFLFVNQLKAYDLIVMFQYDTP